MNVPRTAQGAMPGRMGSGDGPNDGGSSLPGDTIPVSAIKNKYPGTSDPGISGKEAAPDARPGARPQPGRGSTITEEEATLT